MKSLLRAALLLALGAAVLLWVVEPEERAPSVARVPPLPAEVLVTGSGPYCGELTRALGDTFRWAAAAPSRRVWRRGLTVVCDAGAAGSATVAVLDGKTLVWRSTVAREQGQEGDWTSAAVAARVLWERPEVAQAAVRAYLDNQSDVARAGADLWRARHWRQASETLFSALENDWAPQTEAQLYFGLAQSEAMQGRPRQAYWYALAYLGLSEKAPPEDWLRALRGAASLAAENPATVEPQAQALVREAAALRGSGDLAGAFRDIKALCRLAPWAEDYQLEVAAVYDRLGWRALADSWKRRAALTRQLGADTASQRKLSSLLQ